MANSTLNSVGGTVPADGAVTTAKLAADAVTYAKIQNVSATDKVLGRSTSGAGDVEEIALTAAGRALIDDADAAAQRTTLGIAAAITGTKIDDLTAGDDNTDLNATTSAHGLLKKLSNTSTEFMNGVGNWAVPAGGGGGGDMLATLVNTEISVTGTVTATISTMHVCSGTSSDYTVTLPAVSGNTGKFIGFRMSPALTKLVTIDGNASEEIDGATTRVMWANETAILHCNGTAWTKIAGKTIPMSCSMRLSGGPTAQSFNADTSSKINIDYTDLDNTGMMADTGAYKITVKRPGLYQVDAQGYYHNNAPGMSTARARCIISAFKNGSSYTSGELYAHGGGYAVPQINTTTYNAAAADYWEIYAYIVGGSTYYAYGDAPGASNLLAVVELPVW